MARHEAKHPHLHARVVEGVREHRRKRLVHLQDQWLTPVLLHPQPEEVPQLLAHEL